MKKYITILIAAIVLGLSFSGCRSELDNQLDTAIAISKVQNAKLKGHIKSLHKINDDIEEAKSNIDKANYYLDNLPSRTSNN